MRSLSQTLAGYGVASYYVLSDTIESQFLSKSKVSVQSFTKSMA